MDLEEDTSRKTKRWHCGGPRKYHHKVPQSDSNPLKKVYDGMKEYDQGMCEAWRDEIEKLLIFAGLFSAAVTPFTIESYKWLKEDAVESSFKILTQISMHLASSTSNSPSASLSRATPSSFTPDVRSIRINILWFISLVTTLSTVVLGILCLQWLREFTREVPMGPDKAIPIRQERYEGLFSWRVPDVISTLSVILQLAVLIFFLGILDLLWSLNYVVAAVISATVGLLALALIYSTFAPLVQCAYKSPLSWGIIRLVLVASRGRYRTIWKNLQPESEPFWHNCTIKTWADFDIAWNATKEVCAFTESDTVHACDVKGLARALHWTMNKLSPMGIQRNNVHEIFQSLTSQATLPLFISKHIFEEWVKIVPHQDSQMPLFLDLYQNLRSSQHQWHIDHDLLTGWFLGTFVPISDWWQLILELGLRLLNTLDHHYLKYSLFDEILKLCGHWLHPGDNTIDNSDLIFQGLLTFLEYHKYDPRSIKINNKYIGSLTSQHLRFTSVKEDNVYMCYEILRHFKALLEDISKSTDHEPSEPSTAQGKWDPLFASIFLADLDLRDVERWELDVRNIMGKEISIVKELSIFIEDRLLPALPIDSWSTHCIRRQLDMYKKSSAQNSIVGSS